MYRVFELEDGLQLAELMQIEHEKRKYLFAVSLTESPKFLFFKRDKTENGIIPIEDGKLILQLTQLVQEKLSKQVQEQMADVFDANASNEE